MKNIILCIVISFFISACVPFQSKPDKPVSDKDTYIAILQAHKETCAFSSAGKYKVDLAANSNFKDQIKAGIEVGKAFETILDNEKASDTVKLAAIKSYNLCLKEFKDERSIFKKKL